MTACFTPRFGIPDAKPLRGPAVLVHGDIKVSFQDSGLLYDVKKFHVQSFKVNIPLGRTILQKLGQNFYYAKMLEFPFKVGMSFTALSSDLKESELLSSLLKNKKHNITITLSRAECFEEGLCAKSPKKMFMSYEIRGATLDDSSYSLAIGDQGRLIDVSYSSQMASARDFQLGVFINGDYFAGDTLISESGGESLILREENLVKYYDAISTEKDGKSDDDLAEIESGLEVCPE
jgi:hypothetical protein|tara:strand:+ start:14 stop:715 length:702 start_codon:yes stop_codon:yes gene_type:complete